MTSRVENVDEVPSANGDTSLLRGRAAAMRGEWQAAYRALVDADGSSPIGAADLECLATAAALTGRIGDAVGALQRAYHRHLEVDDRQDAVRCAFWVCFHLTNGGEVGQAEGWLARARRVATECGDVGAADGYLLLPLAFQQTARDRDYAAGRATAARAAEVGRRSDEPDLVAMALNVEGRALIAEGRVREGLAALDEAMVSVVAGEVGAVVVGSVYCSVIEACEEVCELQRAQEWTAALTRWCHDQQDPVLFAGRCLVHRAMVRQRRGEWTEALDEAALACARLADTPDRHSTGAAHYRIAELYRCRGDAVAAERAYRSAGEWGHDPQPGLALLWLAQGRTNQAVAAISRALDEAHESIGRAKILPAFVEVMVATGQVATARRGADELAGIARQFGTDDLAAHACLARGAVLVAESSASEALVALRDAVRMWSALGAPYDEAMARVVLAQACRALSDEATAVHELAAARRVFERLGAGPAQERVEALLRRGPEPGAGGLSARELEVLRLLATGRTNRAIAAELTLAVRTVDRHVSNVYTKLGVSSRAAATAYAYEHDLVAPRVG